MTHKEKKILLTGATPFSDNRGLCAIFMGCIQLLKIYFPKDKIIVDPLYFSLFSTYQASFYSKKYKDLGNIHIIKRTNKYIYYIRVMIRTFLLTLWSILKYLGIDVTKVLYLDKTSKTYLQSDIILSTNSGDAFTDRYSHSLIKNLINFCQYISLSLLNKAHIFLPQSIVPFRNSLIKFIAKLILNRTTMIMVREKKSMDYLKKMGVEKRKIFLVPDMAFILMPLSVEYSKKILKDEGIEENQKMIGIAIRDLIKDGNLDKKTYKKYIDCTAKLIEYVIDRFNTIVLLIPHSGIESLKQVSEDVLNNIKNKEKVYCINKREYAVEELKGIIGLCDLFIGTYIHSNINALSMCVPTIGLSYSHKFQGIFEIMEQVEYVYNIKDLTSENLILKVEDAWNNRKKIRKELEERMKEVKKQIIYAGKLVKKVLNKQ